MFGFIDETVIFFFFKLHFYQKKNTGLSFKISIMFIKKHRVSQYTLRLSSPRITPSNSLSEAEWDNEKIQNRW